MQLANEPAFHATSSAHAKRSFASWLRNEYVDIAALEARWDMKVGSFAGAVAKAFSPEAKLTFRTDRGAAPPLGSVKSARLADWTAFNDWRVFRWARTMVVAIQGGDGSDSENDVTAGAHADTSSCHRTLMRLNNALLLSTNLADHGIDRAKLSRLLSLNAFECARLSPRSAPSPGLHVRTPHMRRCCSTLAYTAMGAMVAAMHCESSVVGVPCLPSRVNCA